MASSQYKTDFIACEQRRRTPAYVSRSSEISDFVVRFFLETLKFELAICKISVLVFWLVTVAEQAGLSIA